MKVGDKVKVIDAGIYPPPDGIEDIEYGIVCKIVGKQARVDTFMYNGGTHHATWFFLEELIVICPNKQL